MAQVLNMLLVACALKATFALKINAHSKTDDCETEFDKVDADEVQKCDKQHGNKMDSVSTEFLGADSQEHCAKGEQILQSLLKDCGGMSLSCAKEAAQEMRMEWAFNGETVCEECQAEAEKIQDGESSCSEGDEQDAMQKIAQGLMTQDLKTAFIAAEGMLTQCMKMTKKCAFQYSGVVCHKISDSMQGGMQDGQGGMDGGDADQAPRQQTITVAKRMKDHFGNAHSKVRTASKPQIHKSLQKTLFKKQ